MLLYVPKSILLFLPPFSFALGANIPFFLPSRILFSLESGERVESFENRVSQNPPGHTGSKLSSLCWLVRGFLYKNKVPFTTFLFPPFWRYYGRGKKMITLIVLSITRIYAQVRYNGIRSCYILGISWHVLVLAWDLIRQVTSLYAPYTTWYTDCVSLK